MHVYKTVAEERALFDGKLAMLRRVERECEKLRLEIAKEAERSTLPVGDKVALILEMGHKIYAIKVYRETTGASLIDAKAYIESINTW